MDKMMTPIYDSYADRGPKVVIIITVCPIVSLIAVILRLYTRISIIHNPALDDWFSVISLFFSIATSVCMAMRKSLSHLNQVTFNVLVEVQNGMGRHYQTLTQEEAVDFLKYLRVATNKKVRLACYLVMIFTITYGLEAFFTGVFHCWPINRFWGATTDGKCINKPVLWFLNAGLNITSDLLLLVLPIFILSASTLPRKQKVAICLILSLGGLSVFPWHPFLFVKLTSSHSAAIISVWRLYSLYIVSITHDLSWDISGMVIWSSIELNVGITCACVSTLKPLTTQLFIPHIHRSTSPNSGARHAANMGNCASNAAG